MKTELIGSSVVHALVVLFLFVISAKGSALPTPVDMSDVMNVTPVDALPAGMLPAPEAAVPAPAEDANVETPVAIPDKTPEAVPVEQKKPEPKKTEKKPEPKPAKKETSQETTQAAKPADNVIESKVSAGGEGKTGGSLLGIKGGTPGGRAGTYPDRVSNKIYYVWNNPAKLQQEVMCSVVFRIDRDGKASQIALDQSSGMPAFDNSAVRAVYQAAPYPPFPRSMSDQYIMMRIIFEYTP